jgi:hypothetical protein
MLDLYQRNKQKLQIMKFLHEQSETKEQLVSEITSWYQSMIDLKGKSTKIISSQIGHISKKNVSIKINILDESNNSINVYLTPKSWWVKKMSKGQSTGFTKSVLESIESYN